MNSRYEKIRSKWIKINMLYIWKHMYEHNKKYLMNYEGKRIKNKLSCKQDSPVGRSRDPSVWQYCFFQSDLFIWHALYPMPMCCRDWWKRNFVCLYVCMYTMFRQILGTNWHPVYWVSRLAWNLYLSSNLCQG